HRRPPNGGEWGSFVNGMGVTSDPPSPHTPYLSSSARARETTPDPSGPRQEEEEKKNKNKNTARTPAELSRPHPDATPTQPATPDPSGPREEEEEKKNKNKKTARTPVEIIRAHTDATPDEAAALLDRLTHEHRIDHLTAWLTTAATNGTLTQHLANHRRRTRPTRTELCDAHTRPVDLCPFCAAQRTEAS